MEQSQVMLQQPQLLHLQPTCGLDWITGIAKGALNHPSGLVNKHIPRIGNGAVNISAKFCSYARHVEFAIESQEVHEWTSLQIPSFQTEACTSPISRLLAVPVSVTWHHRADSHTQLLLAYS